ncbi:MAG: YbhB/YbcL family Raf kinase inhibitor-like protein [Halovenus sp.]
MGSNGLAVTRRTVIVGAGVLTVGCLGGDDGEDPAEEDSDEPPSETTNPATGDIDQLGDLTLTSPAFGDGERIPDKYGLEAENVNPPLQIEDVPDGADSLALVVDDPDAVEPAGMVWDHWIVWNVPPETTAIPEDWDPENAAEGTNDYGTVGYGGPNPPDREHRYRFKLFALDTTLELPAETDVEALGSAMDGHVLAQTQLDGTYPA